jgi:hypothetical protein
MLLVHCSDIKVKQSNQVEETAHHEDTENGEDVILKIVKNPFHSSEVYLAIASLMKVPSRWCDHFREDVKYISDSHGGRALPGSVG